jgi:hypothetical protein
MCLSQYFGQKDKTVYFNSMGKCRKLFNSEYEKCKANPFFEITGVLRKKKHAYIHTYWYQKYGQNNVRMVMNDPEC